MARLSKEEKQWRAEEDARSLAESEVIKASPGRLSAAKRAAKRIADEERAKAKAMTTIANTRGKGQASGKAQDDEKRSTRKRDGRRGAVASPKYNVFTRI